MASKNNPLNRQNERLYTYCPKDDSELKIVKKVPGGMFYKCEKCDFTHKLSSGSYKKLKFDWKNKK